MFLVDYDSSICSGEKPLKACAFSQLCCGIFRCSLESAGWMFEVNQRLSPSNFELLGQSKDFVVVGSAVSLRLDLPFWLAARFSGCKKGNQHEANHFQGAPLLRCISGRCAKGKKSFVVRFDRKYHEDRPVGYTWRGLQFSRPFRS